MEKDDSIWNLGWIFSFQIRYCLRRPFSGSRSRCHFGHNAQAGIPDCEMLLLLSSRGHFKVTSGYGNLRISSTKIWKRSVISNLDSSRLTFDLSKRISDAAFRLSLVSFMRLRVFAKKPDSGELSRYFAEMASSLSNRCD